MNFCSKCGADVHDANFCPKCGTPIWHQEKPFENDTIIEDESLKAENIALMELIKTYNRKMDLGGGFIAGGIAVLIFSIFIGLSILLIFIGIGLLVAGFTIHNKAFRAVEKLKKENPQLVNNHSFIQKK